jgi:putative transposase
MNGKHHFLWRAVDQNGYALDILMQSRRDRTATTRVFRTLLKGLCDVPRTIITDTLKSYGAATRDIMPGVECRQPVSHAPSSFDSCWLSSRS